MTTCKVRIPDNNDYVSCEKPIYSEDYCLEHWPNYVAAIYQRLIEARARVADEERALERALKRSNKT